MSLTHPTASPPGHGSDSTLPGARPGRDPERVIKRGPSRIPPEVVAATQRERLFDGLVHTVAEKGYANARVTDICQAAGVSRPAFYALFHGKEDAFLATYRHGTGVLVRLMDAAYAEGGDWRGGVRGAVRVVLEVLAAVPAFATMAIVEIDSVGATARRDRERLLRRFDRFFEEAPSPATTADSDTPATREDLVSAVVGGVYATIHRYVAAGRVTELPELLPLLTYFVLAPFIGRDGATREAATAREAVLARRRSTGAGAESSAPCVTAEAKRSRDGDRVLPAEA